MFMVHVRVGLWEQLGRDPACMGTVRSRRSGGVQDTVRSGRATGVRLNLPRSSMTQALAGYAGLPLPKHSQGVTFTGDGVNIQALASGRRVSKPEATRRPEASAPGLPA